MLEATLLLCWVSFPFTLHFVSCVSTVRSSCSDTAHTHTLAQTDSQIHTDTHTLIPIAVCETFNYEICINNVVGCPYVDVFMYTDLTMRANLFSHVHTHCVRSTTHIHTNQQMYNTKLSAMFAVHIATHYTSTCVHMYWVHVHDQKGKYRHTEYTHTKKNQNGWIWRERKLQIKSLKDTKEKHCWNFSFWIYFVVTTLIFLIEREFKLNNCGATAIEITTNRQTLNIEYYSNKKKSNSKDAVN